MKVGVVILVLLAVVASLGVGYALWSQTLNINGTANTGSLEAQFVDSDVTEESLGDYLDTATYDLTGSGTDQITITVDNAYPGMQGFIYVKVKNIGTIPITNVGFVDPATNLPLSSSFGSISRDPETGAIQPLGTATFKLSLYIDDDADETQLEETHTGYTFSAKILASQ